MENEVKIEGSVTSHVGWKTGALLPSFQYSLPNEITQKLEECVYTVQQELLKFYADKLESGQSFSVTGLLERDHYGTIHFTPCITDKFGNTKTIDILEYHSGFKMQ